LVVTAEEPLDSVPELVEADSFELEEEDDGSLAAVEGSELEPLPLLEELAADSVALEELVLDLLELALLALVGLALAEEAPEAFEGELLEEALGVDALLAPPDAPALRLAAAVSAGSWPEASCT
jgi:hypothetical protein